MPWGCFAAGGGRNAGSSGGLILTPITMSAPASRAAATGRLSRTPPSTKYLSPNTTGGNNPPPPSPARSAAQANLVARNQVRRHHHQRPVHFLERQTFPCVATDLFELTA